MSIDFENSELNYLLLPATGKVTEIRDASTLPPGLKGRQVLVLSTDPPALIILRSIYIARKMRRT
jgi:hypothetical protein